MPDYYALIRFLFEPLLQHPDALRIDCETGRQGASVWIRVAFDREDKGRVFGKGGRTIQSIRTVVTTAARLANQIVFFDIYEPVELAKEVNRNRVRSSSRRK